MAARTTAATMMVLVLVQAISSRIFVRVRAVALTVIPVPATVATTPAASAAGAGCTANIVNAPAMVALGNTAPRLEKNDRNASTARLILLRAASSLKPRESPTW